MTDNHKEAATNKLKELLSGLKEDLEHIENDLDSNDKEKHLRALYYGSTIILCLKKVSNFIEERRK